MTSLMATKETVRMVVIVEEEIRSALRLEAVRRGIDMGDLVTEWVKENAAASLAEVRRTAAAKKKRDN